MKITKIGGNGKASFRIAAYCRVSTDKYEQQESFETQQSYYRKLIESHSNWKSAGIYADEGRSGTSAKQRPQFMRMVEDAEAGKIDIILVKSISRFARNAAECQNYVRRLKVCGVEVRFEREGISSMDASSDFIFSMLAVAAQEESRSISENIRWRYKKNFEKGICRLGNNRLLGYNTDSSGKLTPNSDAWIIKKIFEDYANGMSLQKICENLNSMGAKRLRSSRPFEPVTVRRILRNEKYVGDLCLQKQAPLDYLTKKPLKNTEYTSYYVKNDHEPIICRETWDAVQNRIKAIEQKRKAGLCTNKTKTHYLYGIVFCAECGSPMLRQNRTNRNKTTSKAWSCRGRQKLKNGCRNPSVLEEHLINNVLSTLKTLSLETCEDDEAPEKLITKHIQRIDVSPAKINIAFKRPSI